MIGALTIGLLSAWTSPTPPGRPRSLCARLSLSEQSPAFLTREDGKNGKLAKLLAKRDVPCEELPCIGFERLGGYDLLRDALASGSQGCIVLTSPEAATVFLDAWRAADEPALSPLATVGAGTAAVLTGAGLDAGFVPSQMPMRCRAVASIMLMTAISLTRAWCLASVSGLALPVY